MKSFILSLGLSGILAPSVVGSQGILPASLHALPVQTEIPSTDGTYFGTGFYMLMSTNVFLVTAAHCIFASTNPSDTTLMGSTIGLLSYGSNEMSRLSNFMTIDLSKLQLEGRIKRHPTHDVAVLCVGFSEFPFSNIGFFAISGHQSSKTLTWVTNTCTLFSNVPDGSQSLILGYPEELIKPDMMQLGSFEKALTGADIDFAYPLVRWGSVSQKNLAKELLILNTDVYGGNSGGPVLNVQHTSSDTPTYKIIGIITNFVPALTRVIPEAGITNSIEAYSGYSVVEPIDFAIELMRQFSITNNTPNQ